MDELFVSSSAFENKGLIPIEYTGRGRDISPELTLENLDGAAKSMVVIMNDMGHIIPAFNHWVIWNLPRMAMIPKGIPWGDRVETLGGAVQGVGYGRHRYCGPKPPFHSSHVYQFHVYALDTCLDLPSKTRKKALLRAMEGHVLQQGVIEGHYR